MLFDRKYDAAGNFIKDKCREVIRGDHQRVQDGEDNFAPTVNTAAVFAVAAIAASEGLHTATIDVTGAFLKGYPLEKPVFMRLDRYVASIVVELRPHYKKYLRHDGSMIVRINKPLYGLREAAKQWNMHITDSLKKFGFVQSRNDGCLYLSVQVQEG